MWPQSLPEKRFLADRTAIRRYADITRDYNPIHLDPVFAEQTPMRGVIAHGMLSLSLIWQCLSEVRPPGGCETIFLDVRFVRPVREDDWVIAGGSLTERAGTYDVWVRAQSPAREEIVISGTARFDPDHLTQGGQAR